MFIQVSSEKGVVAGSFYSTCGYFCPQKCIGTWMTLTGHPYGDTLVWKKDSTLAVNGQGNKGYIFIGCPQIFCSHKT